MFAPVMVAAPMLVPVTAPAAICVAPTAPSASWVAPTAPSAMIGVVTDFEARFCVLIVPSPTTVVVIAPGAIDAEVTQPLQGTPAGPAAPSLPTVHAANDAASPTTQMLLYARFTCFAPTGLEVEEEERAGDHGQAAADPVQEVRLLRVVLRARVQRLHPEQPARGQRDPGGARGHPAERV